MEVLITAVYVGLSLGAAMCLYRVAVGPTVPDRAVALFVLGVLVVPFCAAVALHMKDYLFVNVGIAWALFAFIGAAALAKFMEGKRFDE